MNYRKIMFYFILLCFISKGNGQAATLRVPSQYATPNAAAAAANDGDIIEIEAGTYTGTGIVATWSKNNLIIRGVNGRAHMNAENVTISNKKAIWLPTGDNITIENIEFSNARVPDQNGAGIKSESSLLTVKNCYFYNNEMGLIGSSIAKEIVIESCEFNKSSRGEYGKAHNIYIVNSDKFTMKYCYSHHATIGHNVKTRAKENYILYNRIMDETTGNASYQIDVPDGGLTYIIGNTIHQGKNADNVAMISYAVESRNNPVQELYVSGNTLVNDRSSGVGIKIAGTPVSKIVNNIFDNLATTVNIAVTVFENNLESSSNFFVDRSNFDFRLTEKSPAINRAIDPGEARGFKLLPTDEYVHPLGRKQRINDGKPDIGAFEYAAEVIRGDINGDGNVNLNDAILSLSVCSSTVFDDTIVSAADVNQDDIIGIQEAIYVLQFIAGFRNL